MKLALLAFVLSGFLTPAQDLLISSGCMATCTPAPGFVRDQYFTGGTTQAVAGIGVYAQLRYGAAFSYDIPRANGFYDVTFDLAEPSQNGAGLRVFTITANGATTAPLDLFALAGLNAPHPVALRALVLDGRLRVSVLATARTGLLNGIEVRRVAQPMPTLLSIAADGSFQPLAIGSQLYVLDNALNVSFVIPPPTAKLVDWRACASVPAPGCNGFAFFSIANVDGSPAGDFLAFHAPPGLMLDPAHWTAQPLK